MHLYVILIVSFLVSGCNTDDELSGNSYSLMTVGEGVDEHDIPLYRMSFENGNVDLIDSPENVDGEYTLDDGTLEINLEGETEEGHILIHDLAVNENEEGSYVGFLESYTVESEDEENEAGLNIITGAAEGSEINLYKISESEEE